MARGEGLKAERSCAGRRAAMVSTFGVGDEIKGKGEREAKEGCRQRFDRVGRPSRRGGAGPLEGLGFDWPPLLWGKWYIQ